jgi:hypothetical protein
MAERIIATNVNIAPLVGGISSGVSINSPTLIRSAINSPTINRGFFNSPKVKNEITFGPSFFSSSNQIGSKTLNFTKQGFVGTIYDSRTGGSFLIGANHIDPSPNLSPGSNNISPNRYFSPSHNIVISGPSLHNTPFRDIANCPSKVGANIDVGGAYESPAANSPFSNNNQTISINSGQTLFFPPGSSNTIGGGFTKKNAFINVRPSSSPGMSTIGVGINSPTSSPNVGFHVDTGSRFDCPVTITNNGSGTTIGWTKSNGGKKDWTTNPTPGNSPTFGINSSPNTAQNGSPLGYSPGFNVEITASSLFNCPVHYTAPVTFHSPTTFNSTPTFSTTLKATKIKYGQLRGTGVGAGPGGANYISGGYDQGGGSATLFINANSPKVSAGTNNLYIGTGAAGGSIGPGVTDEIFIGASHNTTTFNGGINVGGAATFSGTEQSTSTSTGAVRITNGGLGVAGNLNVGTYSSLYNTHALTVNSTTNAVSMTGNLIAYGNIEAQNLLQTGGNISCGGNATIGTNLSVSGNTTLNGDVTIDDTPNLPGIHLTSNTPAFRSELGVYGGNDNATFNTITLTTLSNTALVVQPLNHSKPRLQVSNTSSPSVINGTFNGSPTFAGPVTFTSSPTMRGLKITNGGLPVFANNAAATSGGLALGQVYRASGFGSPVAGTLMVRF